MNNAPSGPPMRGAAFDSRRSLRAPHGLHLLLDPNRKYRDQKITPTAPPSSCAALVVIERITRSSCAGQHGRLHRYAHLWFWAGLFRGGEASA